MRKRDLLTLVTGLAREADNFDSDEVSKSQQVALDYYFMRPRGDEVPGQSQTVSGDISAMVEANLAQMLESLTSKRIVDFDPEHADDETAAEIESIIVNQEIMGRNNGWVILHEAIKDALLLRNGWVKLWIDEKSRGRVRNYSDVTPEAYAEIAMRSDKVLKWNKSKGQLRVREQLYSKRLRARAVPPENVLYTSNWNASDSIEIPFIAERRADIRSDLIEMFPDSRASIEELPAHVETSQAGAARNPRKQANRRNPSKDASLDLIEWFEAYVLVDTDGDGIAERRRVSFVESKVILEDVDHLFVNLIPGAILLNPHRLLGVSLFDKLKQIQDKNTGFERSAMNNANAANKSRTASLENKVNEDDLADGAVNGNIRVRGVADVRQAITALQVSDVTTGINANIEAQKRSRAELGGAALDMSQANMQLPDRTGSQGIDRAYSVMEQLAGMMMRTLAETLARNMYLLAHAMLRENFDEPRRLKLRGAWIDVNPKDWPERTRATVRLGQTQGQRRAQRDALTFVIEAIIKLAQAGFRDILVTIPGLYQALIDWCQAAELQFPEKYFLDPRSDEGKAALEKVQKQIAADKQAQQKLTDVALGLEQLRIALGKYDSDAARALEWRVEKLKAEVEEMKIVGKATADLEKQKLEGEAEEEKAETDGALLDRVEGLLADVKALDSGDDKAD